MDDLSAFDFPLSCNCDVRCKSSITIGTVVLRCQRPTHEDDEHKTIHESWRTGDDRELRI